MLFLILMIFLDTIVTTKALLVVSLRLTLGLLSLIVQANHAL